MKKNTAWSDQEIQTAITAYFELLEDQYQLKPTNKARIYRKLTAMSRVNYFVRFGDNYDGRLSV